MWTSKFCLSWLREHYEETDGGSVYANDLFSKFSVDGGEKSQASLGKYMKLLFPSVTNRKIQTNGKKVRVYGGIEEKKMEEVHNEIDPAADNFELIRKWLPVPFFVSDNESDHIECGVSSDVVNGHDTLKKIQFFKSGIWELRVGQTTINLEELGIQNTFQCTKQTINDICFIVKKLKSCQGKPKGHQELGHKGCVITEYFGEDQVQIYRATSCKRILSACNISNCCRNCQGATDANRNELKENKIPKLGDTSPIPSKTGNNSNITESLGVEDIKLAEDNDADMREVLENVLPNASGPMLDMLLEQKKNLVRHPQGRRWDKATISLCLSLWCRSRKNYEQLKSSKILCLPSGSTLKYYKGVVDQQSGFQHDMFLWMSEEAKTRKSSESSFLGGICIDEMSIQDDLCMVTSNGETRLVGFVDMGTDGENMRILSSGEVQRPLATHVLQFLYLGLNGFRFPFACFPVTQTKAGNLHCLFWEAVKFLNMYDFKVLFVSMDGAQTNRDFMKLFFEESSPRLGNFATRNIWTPTDPDILFIMDFSHVVKRIRNNINKSGNGETFKRNLFFKQHIHWEHWIQAYKWDRDTNAFPIHRRLTHDHLYLNQESKMRNKLAEDVMDAEMLNLMECYQRSIGEDGYLVDDSIALLKVTSVIIEVFRDRRPVHDVEDRRLDQLTSALGWFEEWQKNVLETPVLRPSEKEKRLMSVQTRDDLCSCLLGFNSLCKTVLKTKRTPIVPARINSDVIENIFCQQRGIINGNNTNPNFYQYVKNINTVLIGQNVVSKNSNADYRGCEPLCFHVNRPCKRKVISKTTSEKPRRKPLATIN